MICISYETGKRFCFLISGVQHTHARLKQESQVIKIKEIKKDKRRDYEENRERQFEKERRVIELEKINTILKWAIKKPRQFDIGHGLNKTGSINYSASSLKLHQNKSAIILRVLKKEIHVFTRYDLVFNEQEELREGAFRYC